MTEPTDALKAEVRKQRSTQDVAILVTLDDGSGSPLRLSNQSEVLSRDPVVLGIVSRGLTYGYAPMSVPFPGIEPGQLPTPSLVVENLAPEAAALALSPTVALSVTIEIVFRELPDVVQASYSGLTCSATEVDEIRITLPIGVDLLAAEPFPGVFYTPSNCPALFAGPEIGE